jgi:hypothetical protein
MLTNRRIDDMADDDSDVNIETLAETENYVAWISHEPDGEDVYHLELGAVTLHFYKEEFDEVLELVAEVRDSLRGRKAR